MKLIILILVYTRKFDQFLQFIQYIVQLILALHFVINIKLIYVIYFDLFKLKLIFDDDPDQIYCIGVNASSISLASGTVLFFIALILSGV